MRRVLDQLEPGEERRVVDRRRDLADAPADRVDSGAASAPTIATAVNSTTNGTAKPASISAGRRMLSPLPVWCYPLRPTVRPDGDLSRASAAQRAALTVYQRRSLNPPSKSCVSRYVVYMDY